MKSSTVARIVDMMFENTEMTEEVAALHDEVMNNCQERYQDLIAAGVYEDDAIAAVVESLRGLEDVIGQYKRKAARPAPQPAMEYTAPAEENDEPVIGRRDMVFSPQEVSRIDLTLVSEDVAVEESDDGMYHVRWDCDGEETIACRAENGTLRVERIPGAQKGGHAPHKVRIDARDGMRNMQVNVDGETYSGDAAADALNGVGSMLENLGRTLGRMFSSMKQAFNACDQVTIAVPFGATPSVKLVTTSGDVDVQDVALSELEMITVSGDLTVEMGQDAPLKSLKARSTSGDVTVNACAQEMQLSSTSGDVEIAGAAAKLSVGTVSGDVDVTADVESVEFKAISGDVELEFTGDAICQINGSTVSGDIDVDLPDSVGVIAINTHTRSGDMTTRHATSGFGPTVTGSITSLSGDITIR